MTFQTINLKISKIYTKNNNKINIFLIRKINNKRIVNQILSVIKKNKYNIEYKLIIKIDNKKEFYQKFYPIYRKDWFEDILKNNNNSCMVVITNYISKDKNNQLKRYLRRYFKNNIIHSSDSPRDATRELKLLINKKNSIQSIKL